MIFWRNKSFLRILQEDLVKTFAEHICRNFEDNRNVLAASVALVHSSLKTTMEYYMSVGPNRLRDKWLELNLGLEVINRYISP